jgi:hypothetical protein
MKKTDKEQLNADLLEHFIENAGGRGTVPDAQTELQEDLQSLVRLSEDVKTGAIGPSEEFRARARKQLVIAMNQPQSRHALNSRQAGSWADYGAATRRFGFCMTAIAAIVLTIITGSGIADAAHFSMPDDLLYPVKRSIESAGVSLSVNPAAKADLQLRVAQSRLSELAISLRLHNAVTASSVAEIARSLDAALAQIKNAGATGDIQNLINQFQSVVKIENSRLDSLSTDANAAAKAELNSLGNILKNGILIAEAARGNPAFLETNPSVADNSISSNHFVITGPFISSTGSRLDIGGIAVENVNIRNQNLIPGKIVEIEGIVRPEGVFVFKSENEERSGERVSINGVFNGSNADGTIWNISGIHVGRFTGIAAPSVGSPIHLNILLRNGEVVSGRVESEVDHGDIIDSKQIYERPNYVDSSYSTGSNDAGNTSSGDDDGSSGDHGSSDDNRGSSGDDHSRGDGDRDGGSHGDRD